ncbi:MAG: hypothetical protein QUS11_06575 [Candidatus Fermentibacter sp.]|nr:hypothetical protein [Candidatus Fermentibacter sp.]
MKLIQASYAVYLCTYMGNNGPGMADKLLCTYGEGREEAATDDENIALLTAAALGSHHLREKLPPATIDEVKAELARMTGIE